MSANSTHDSLLALADLVGIPHKRGWKTRLASWIGVDLNLLTTWIRRDRIPEEKIRKIRNMGWPDDRWLITPDQEIRPPVGREPRPNHGPNIVPMPRHVDIVEAFRNPDQARRINMKLLELEARAPDKLSTLEAYLDGLLAGAAHHQGKSSTRTSGDRGEGEQG